MKSIWQFYITIKGIEKRVNSERTDSIVLDSFIVSPTLMHELKWGEGWQTLQDFGKRHVLMMKNEPDGYVRRMLGLLLNCN